MITQTSENAIKALTYLACRNADEPVTPREISEIMACSPSYLAKIMGQLAKAGLVHSRRGVHGGVMLARPPKEITLLEIVEACEGMIVGNYCRAIGDAHGPVCAFHDAMLDIYEATKKAFARWTLRDMAARPEPAGPLKGNVQCRMKYLQPICAGLNCPAAQPAKQKPKPKRKAKT